MSSSLKRKASKALEAGSSGKKLKSTIDSFFSPNVPLPMKSSDDPTQPSHAALNPEQTRVLRMAIDEGKSVFFTGAAGTGKSLLLRAIILALRKKYAKTSDAISITASTGMAASNVGGMTIHAWGAVTPNCTDMTLMIKSIRTCRPALQRWKKTKLHDIAVNLRKPTTRPFGGIQLIVTGDFFQLPPVTKSNQEPIFAFESPAWRNTLESTVNLTHVFRQKDSSELSPYSHLVNLV
ncbi:PIF1-like helicase-domain-containing protein [Rhodocollybia butyracea]|uniref:ATP-dependent DNA helicase n=1 Tax=Rhodocollybia butyracea TaxID=206335 RepID=A0A9P5PRH6_9AGAR|nr:PIF1-like helicase-domain-containing protein [Rhodocollybia butyracea]